MTAGLAGSGARRRRGRLAAGFRQEIGGMIALHPHELAAVAATLRLSPKTLRRWAREVANRLTVARPAADGARS